MFKVLVDLERTKNMNCGLGQYCLHLGKSLLAARDTRVEPHFLLPPSPPAALLAVKSSVRATYWRRKAFQQFALPWLTARRCGIDLWHATHQDTKYFPLDPHVPFVLTIHDLNFLRTKKRAGSIQRRLRKLQGKVDRATIVTTASQHAASEIQKYLKLRGKRIAIVPHGICLNLDDVASARPGFLPPGRFLFSIGEVVAKKNFHVLVGLAERLPQFRFVIAGSLTSDYAKRLIIQVCQRGLADRVLLPGPVSDADRVWLYQHCEAFLFPSLAEGFGLPVIEAMHCGRPVFSSTATSLPEVGGDLAFYWEHFDADYMAEVFQAGMTQIASTRNAAAKLQSHASQFSWQAAARQYLDLYKSVLGVSAAKRVA